MPDPGLARAARLRRLAGILLLAMAVAGAGYLLVRFGFGSGFRSPAPAPDKAAASALPTTAPIPVEAPTAAALQVVVVPTPPRVRRESPDVTPLRSVARGAEATSPSAPASSTTSISAPAPAADQARAAPHPSRPAASTAGIRTYAGSFPLAGGEKIELGGIAWSEEEPRALLNDRVVGVGGYVDGYSVSKIETDRVVLEKDGATIVLMVK
ncbi:MAG TPA: hypothetical protein VGK26_10065 [Thermoanaerobaculia bacterium]|jgi:hypothetical protein